jgi:hypothetical protein
LKWLLDKTLVPESTGETEALTMTKLVLPSDVGRQLTDAHDCVELCDEVGRTIGFFTPLAERAPSGPRVSDDELKRRDLEEPTYSTDEVMAHLRTL